MDIYACKGPSSIPYGYYLDQTLGNLPSLYGPHLWICPVCPFTIYSAVCEGVIARLVSSKIGRKNK